jgi:hypothetical protein
MATELIDNAGNYLDIGELVYKGNRAVGSPSPAIPYPLTASKTAWFRQLMLFYKQFLFALQAYPS